MTNFPGNASIMKFERWAILWVITLEKWAVVRIPSYLSTLKSYLVPFNDSYLARGKPLGGNSLLQYDTTHKSNIVRPLPNRNGWFVFHILFRMMIMRWLCTLGMNSKWYPPTTCILLALCKLMHAICHGYHSRHAHQSKISCFIRKSLCHIRACDVNCLFSFLEGKSSPCQGNVSNYITVEKGRVVYYLHLHILFTVDTG